MPNSPSHRIKQVPFLLLKSNGMRSIDPAHRFPIHRIEHRKRLFSGLFFCGGDCEEFKSPARVGKHAQLLIPVKGHIAHKRQSLAVLIREIDLPRDGKSGFTDAEMVLLEPRSADGW